MTEPLSRCSPDIVDLLLQAPDSRADAIYVMEVAAAEIARLRFVVKTLRFEAEGFGDVAAEAPEQDK